MTGYFYGKQIPYNYGEVSAISSSVEGTTLKLVPPEGYFSGEDFIKITDSDFIASNILDTASIFGINGEVSVISNNQSATSSVVSGTELKLTIPEGYYDGTIKVTKSDENFISSNIKDGVNIFGLAGTLVGGGDYEFIKTGQTTSVITGDDGDLERGLTIGTRFTDNLDNTITDNITGLIWVKDTIPITTSQLALAAKNTWSEASASYIAGDLVQYPPTPSSWQPGVQYVVGNKISGEMGYGVFTCIQDHESEYDVTPPGWGSDWTSYWVESSYPLGTAWANGTPYTVGTEVVVSEMEYTSVYICIKNHTSSYENAPGPMSGGNYLEYWVPKNNKYVCILNHTSDMTKTPINATYWVEAPFTGSAANLTTERAMEWETALYNVNKLTYLSSSWIVPNIVELIALMDFGKSAPATNMPGMSSNGYWSSTKSIYSEYGENNFLYIDLNTCESRRGSDYTQVRVKFFKNNS